MSRRNVLKAGMAGMAGSSLPTLLRERAWAAEAGRPVQGRKSVILLWMTGGPSQIATWDPKSDRPMENRGPFGVVPTRLPGTFFPRRREPDPGSRFAARREGAGPSIKPAPTRG